jgi:hypothetical protein
MTNWMETLSARIREAELLLTSRLCHSILQVTVPLPERLRHQPWGSAAVLDGVCHLRSSDPPGPHQGPLSHAFITVQL